MARHRPFFSRYSYGIVAVTALLAPFLIHGARLALQSNENKVLDWLPTSFSETNDLKWFRQHFQADGFVVISWEGCRLGGDPRDPNAPPDDPRIEQLAQALVPLADGEDQSGPLEAKSPESNYFRSVTTGRRLLNQLTEAPMEIPYELAVERLKGVVIGPDGHQTCLVAMLSKEGLDHFREAIGRGNQAMFQIGQPEGVLFRKLREVGVDPETVHLGGPPVDNVAIDEEGERTLVRLGVLAGVVGLTLAGWSLRSVRLTIIVFICGILSAAASLAVVWVSGHTTDAILMSMPALVYVLAISGAVHLVNYYRRELEEGGYVGAPGRALAHGWKPAVLCSTTTAIGLLSLYSSELTPIRKFGTFSAIGVMLMLITLFTFLPAALELWPPKPKQRRTGRRQQAAEAVRGFWRRSTAWTQSISFDWFWDRVGRWIIRHHAFVAVASFATIATVGVGVVRTQTTIDLMKLFDRDARILKDYRWLEQNLGRLVPLEVVLRFDKSMIEGDDENGEGDAASREKTLNMLERMEVVAALQRAVTREFGSPGRDMIGPPMSAVTFAPPLTGPRQGTRAIFRRTATNSRLEENYDAFIDGGYLSVDEDGSELWRISLRVAAFQEIDYGRFSNDLRGVVDPLIAKFNDKWQPETDTSRDSSENVDRPPLSAVYTGVVPIVYKAQRELLDSLVEGTFWSFVTITPVLMLVVRSFAAGLVAMLPNALPVLTIFGSMGWLGIAVDIGSMMSASIALGVAVDDTIHFLTWYRESLQQHHDRRRAIMSAYRRCATPTVQAALISGVGLSVFALSTFMPTRQFGLLMLTILTAGAVAELIMLPALLAGPLGRVFTPARKPPVDVHKPHFSETVKYAKEP